MLLRLWEFFKVSNLILNNFIYLTSQDEEHMKDASRAVIVGGKWVFKETRSVCGMKSDIFMRHLITTFRVVHRIHSSAKVSIANWNLISV
jgi:hypothetical protein